ncbi:MAG: ATP-binding protein [Thermoanaerobaculia bacterium]
MLRVVVTGSECTGKTTLAEALAEHYATVLVPEFVRQYVAEKRSAPEYRDVEAIARGQIELEIKLAAEISGLLIQDTDLLSTVVYSHHYYGKCPRWIEYVLRERAAQLYLLAGIDVPWVADGDQRDRGDRREEMQQLFRQALIDRRLKFIEISGPLDNRLEAAISAIDELVRAASP